MLAAERLLHLYPRAWRERYGEEFLAILGQGKLSAQQVIDVVSGAIDAWLSPEVRNAIGAGGLATTQGGSNMLKTMLACERRSAARMTERDGLIGAAVMIGTSLLFLVLGFAARNSGWTVASEVLRGTAFPASFMLSTPFWVMKGQPWKAQAVIVGGTVIFLLAIGWLATAI